MRDKPDGPALLGLARRIFRNQLMKHIPAKDKYSALMVANVMATFAQFGAADLAPVTRRQLSRGERFRELLKQDENAPISFENMVTMFHIANEGALEDVPVEKVRAFEAAWYDYVSANLPDVLKSIAESGELGEADGAKLAEAVKGFKQTVTL